MRSLFAALVVALLSSSPAHAVTLTVAPDKLTYSIGETVLIVVTGDHQGAKLDEGILGRLEYDAALTSTVTSSQTQHTRGNGAAYASTGSLPRGDGFATVFNQVFPCCSPQTVDQIQIATATLTADAAGVVEILWSDDSGWALDFFGLTNASVGSPPNPVASFTIVPEPAAIALLGLGLVALASAARGRMR